jgi:sulfopropanediol 3-dehydrogenase
MGVEYLKRASKNPETESAGARKVAAEMPAAIRQCGEQAVRVYARDVDKWIGDIMVSELEI